MKQGFKHKIQLLFLLVAILTFVAGCFFKFESQAVNAQEQEITNEYEDKSVLVTMDKSVGGVNKHFSKSYFGDIAISSIKDLTEVSNENIGNINKENFHQILKIELQYNDRDYVLQAVEKIKKIDGIIDVAPNYTGKFCATANDQSYSLQWNLHNAHGIDIEAAWNISTGSKTVRVGIIDTGISRHEDLIGNLGAGWNFVDNNQNTEDSEGHGTHVAGIIGAVGDNQIGISGVCKDLELVPLKIANGGSWSSEMVIRAITYAAERWGTVNQIDLLNFSGWNFSNNTMLYNAINNFPGIFVGIAGNGIQDSNGVSHGINIDTTPNYPGSFNCNNLITVGSLTSTGARSEFSNYGLNSVDIYAPGSSILSTVPNNQYAEGSGTSMAAPHVTGVAALLLSVDPTLTASHIKEIIVSTADDITINIPNGTQTVKKLNAYTAVSTLKRDMLFAGGRGTASDPYLISNEQQFYNIELAYNSVYIPREGTKKLINYAFKLTNNIMISRDWTSFSYTFSGDFDGNGYYISYNMYLTQEDINQNTHQGLFRVVGYGGKIHDLELMNCTITSDTSTTLTKDVDIGIVAGYFIEAGNLTNVTVTNPKIECKISYAYIGAIAGSFLSTSARNCVVREQNGTSSITNNTSGCLGGMAGLGEGLAHFSGCKVKILLTNKEFGDGENASMGEVIGNSNANPNDYNINAEVTMDKGSCVAAGSLITLVDGTQKPVESLMGDEMLLVWNLKTGQFDVAPILFIDYDTSQKFSVINLSFSNGEAVKVISEHGFWDYNLNRYVYLDKGAAQYIGHWFCSQTTDEFGNMVVERVQLTGVTVQTEQTAAYSPVTYGHLCYFVDGMLSMPGGISGLFNIFEVDAETMKYDQTLMQADIEEYGLFTYEEFATLVPISEDIFEAFNGQYLKVAIGKGLIDIPTLNNLAQRYAKYFI